MSDGLTAHQLNGVQSYLDLLNTAARNGIAIDSHARMWLRIDGDATNFHVAYDYAANEYVLESA